MEMSIRSVMVLARVPCCSVVVDSGVTKSIDAVVVSCEHVWTRTSNVALGRRWKNTLDARHVLGVVESAKRLRTSCSVHHWYGSTSMGVEQRELAGTLYSTTTSRTVWNSDQAASFCW